LAAQKSPLAPFLLKGEIFNLTVSVSGHNIIAEKTDFYTPGIESVAAVYGIIE